MVMDYIATLNAADKSDSDDERENGTSQEGASDDDNESDFEPVSFMWVYYTLPYKLHGQHCVQPFLGSTYKQLLILQVNYNFKVKFQFSSHEIFLHSGNLARYIQLKSIIV